MNLHLGCGNNYKEGWVNVDMGDCRVDVEHNLEIFPWPFENDSAEYILMNHVLEHIDKNKFIDFVRELYRVCSNNAKIEITSP